MKSAMIGVLVSSVIFVACETTYTYVPTTGAAVTVAGHAAASYGIPPDAPRGDLSVASFGFADVSPRGDDHQHLAALHLRMIVTDRDSVAWSVDTREQRLLIDGRGADAPAFASASPGTPPPLVTVEPNRTRVVDLFFMLPSDLQSAEELPAFDAVWQVNAGARVVSGTTPFQRLVVEPAPSYDWDYGYEDYWGPPYFYDDYPIYGFRGAIVVPPHFYHHPVIMHRGLHGPFRGGHPGGFHGGFHGGGGGHHR